MTTTNMYVDGQFHIVVSLNDTFIPLPLAIIISSIMKAFLNN